jgi:hypothetical protein
MTDFLKRLLHDYGLLHISIVTMEQARKRWSSALGPIKTDGELAEVPLAKDEPVIVVRISKTNEVEFLSPGEHEIEFIDRETEESAGQVSVWELPEDEFYFFRAFRTGLVGLASELPTFYLGMCLVHAHGLFEHYLNELLKAIFLSRPEMLGTAKMVRYADVLESYPSMPALLALMADNELRELFYKSWRDILQSLREKYGFKQLATTSDDEIIKFSLIRNCLVHNHGVADVRLEKQSKAAYKYGDPISIDMETVWTGIQRYRSCAVEIDSIAQRQHFIK